MCARQAHPRTWKAQIAILSICAKCSPEWHQLSHDCCTGRHMMTWMTVWRGRWRVRWRGMWLESVPIDCMLLCGLCVKVSGHLDLLWILEIFSSICWRGTVGWRGRWLDFINFVSPCLCGSCVKISVPLELHAKCWLYKLVADVAWLDDVALEISTFILISNDFLEVMLKFQVKRTSFEFFSIFSCGCAQLTHVS